MFKYSFLTQVAFQFSFGVRNMHITKECFLPFNVALALQKDSLFTNSFDKKLRQLVEGGFINKWTDDEFIKIAKKADYHNYLEAQSLTVHHLQVICKAGSYDWYHKK